MVAEDRTLEKSFGWLFFVVKPDTSGALQTEQARFRLILVNKHVEQIIASSIDYTPERLIEIYSSLLSQSQAHAKNWCLTPSIPFPWKRFARDRLATKAKEMGLYELE